MEEKVITNRLMELLDVAQEAATLGYLTALSSSVDVVKADLSVHDNTTVADISAADKIVSVLGNKTPEISVLIEEGIEEDKWKYIKRFMKKNSTYWVVDPIDGSTNRKNGQFFWGVSVCLVVDNVPTLAAVAYPRLGSLNPNLMTGLCAKDEKFLLLNGVLQPRIDTLNKGIWYAKIAYDASYIAEDTTEVLKIIYELRDAFETHSPCQGSQVVTGVNVALGNLDAHITFHAMPWDIAAALVFLKIIGGEALEWGTWKKATIASFKVVYGVPSVVREIVEHFK